MTQQEINNKIAILEKGINSPATPDLQKNAMRKQVEKLKYELSSNMKFMGSNVVNSEFGSLAKKTPTLKKEAVKAPKDKSVAQLIFDYDAALKKREKGKVIAEMQRRLKLKNTSEADKKEIHEFLGVHGKARHKEKVVLIDGRDVRNIPCDELLQMVIDRRKAAIKSGKKTRAKPVMEKIAGHVGHAVKDAIKEIPKATLDKNPEKWEKILKEIADESKKFLKKLKNLLGKSFDEKDIDYMLEDIEDFLIKKMTKE